MLNVLQNTSIWNWPKLAALEEETRAQTVTLGTGQFIPLDHGSEPLESDDEELLRFESELAERYRNNGFTLDEVQELLKRGVDPQDERAHDILKTLLRSKCL
ncbi:hypothetical protein BC834DRAFT_880951 [Gloeopeniophorella convolvens]|nr:hypothetical protein BC834DRAFT_880951 [Gloeopeniophorella convolvens]